MDITRDFEDEKRPEDEALGTRVANHVRKNPALVASYASLMAVCAYGGYKFKERGDMPISLYILKFRVLAQGAAIGCITLGMLYHMVNHNLLHNDKKD